MEKVNILMDRIRSQVGKLPQLNSSGSMQVIAERIPPAPVADPELGTASMGHC